MNVPAPFCMAADCGADADLDRELLRPSDPRPDDVEVWLCVGHRDALEDGQIVSVNPPGTRRVLRMAQLPPPN